MNTPKISKPRSSNRQAALDLICLASHICFEEQLKGVDIVKLELRRGGVKGFAGPAGADLCVAQLRVKSGLGALGHVTRPELKPAELLLSTWCGFNQSHAFPLLHFVFR